MATNLKFKKKRSHNRQSREAQAFDNARAVATRYATQIFAYFSGLPGVTNCETNLDNGPTKFFAFKTVEKQWFGNTICFDYEGYSFRLYFAFQYDASSPTINELSRNDWPTELEPKYVYRHLANYWVQLNISKTYEPYDDASFFLIRFDASPDWQNVDYFPHHKHLYNYNRNTAGLPFDGTRDRLLEELTEIIQNEIMIRT